MVCDDDRCGIVSISRDASRCMRRTRQLLRAAAVVDMRRVVVLLHALPLSLRCPLRYRLREKGQEFAHRAALVERERRHIICADNDG